MKKFILSTLLFPCCAAIAQMPMGMHRGMIGHDSSFSVSGYRSIGASYQKFDELNDRIKKYPQYKELPDVMGTLGMGSIMHKGHFVGMNGITGGFGKKGKKEKGNSTLAFIGISADVGYDFFGKESRISLYPAVGIGVELYRAKFNKDVSSTAFNDVLQSNTTQNNIRPVVFKNAFVTYRGGLNFEAKSKDKTGSIGLQAGYIGSFNERSWRVNESQLLQNSPSDRLSRFYANFFMTKTMNWSHKHSM